MDEFQNMDIQKALEGLNIPEYKPEGPEDEIVMTESDIQDIKEVVIDEVESLESFSKVDAIEGAETETEVTEEVETEAASTDEGSDEDASPIRVLAEWAGQKGIIDFDAEKFEDSETYLETKFNEVIDKGIEEYKKSLPEEIAQLVENFKPGVPFDELLYSKSREIEWNSLNESAIKGTAEEPNKELQKRLISELMLAKDPDLTDKEIDKKIKRYEDTLVLEEEALEAWEKLKVFETKYQAQLLKEADDRRVLAEQNWQTQLKNIEQQIMASDEIIPGYKLSAEEKKKMFEDYTKVVSKGKTPLIKKMESDPKAHLKVLQLFSIFDGDLSKIKTKLNTEVIQKTKEKVNTYKDDNPLNKLDIKKIRKAVDIQKKKSKF